MFSAFKRFLIGRHLKSTALGEQKLNILKALAILSSAALSSTAYGTEQILLLLVHSLYFNFKAIQLHFHYY